ncbi:9595_t:CDS:2 [Gigaspora rosea]|nr:9595_t:CDS:2 [Gigaspora rosea]
MTFLNLNFDWIEGHASSAKITKSATNSGIVKVDSKATRYSDGQEVWHMEVAGGPCKTTDLYTLGTNDSLCIEYAPGWKISFFGTCTALIPFSSNGRNQYKALLRMMAIFHITKQEELMGEIE